MSPMHCHALSAAWSIASRPCSVSTACGWWRSRCKRRSWWCPALAPPRWLPASTQGTIGIQNRAGDDAVRELLDPLNHAGTALRTRAERTVATALEGSCQVPLAVFAETESGELTVTGMVGTPDGATVLRASRSGPQADADDLASDVAADLLGQGAADIISALR